MVGFWRHLSHSGRLFGGHASHTHVVTPGAASAQYARAKHATYRDLYSASPSVAFTPAIVDIFGHFHDSFLCFARELATYTVSSTVSEDVASSATGASQGSALLLHRWLQRLSVSLQRDQASQILMLAGARSELQSPFRSTHLASLLASTDIRPAAALH